MINLKLLSDSNQPIKQLNNPFKKDKVTSISLNYSKVMFENYFSWRASISFKNGNTEGTQRFEVTDKESENSFGEITLKSQSFINSL